MNKQKMITTIKQEFMLKRIRAEEKAEETLNKLKEDKEFKSLYEKYSATHLNYIKSKYEKENLELKKEVENLKQNLAVLMFKQGLTFQDLNPKYECSLCQDTGVYEGKICSCFLNELNKKISLMSSSQTNFKSFEDCNECIMDETDKKTMKLLKDWCALYPKVNKININILGGAGRGKTFMLECVASDLIKNGNVVCFKTAFELNELARLYHMGKSYEFSDCINADILIIDDLGTEPVLKNVTKEYFYNLINVRQIKKRPTFISSNLSQEDILARYDERIYSRLANKNLAINISLTSSDKRING
ncbi:MAG: ATP-binding protein [Clostridia bacterium]|nr:ATP-binding protein [Clostridia bacterium]